MQSWTVSGYNRIMTRPCLLLFCGLLLGQDKAPAPTLQVQLADAKKTADMEKLKRVDAQLQVIQTQIEKTVSPLIAEKNEAYQRLCASEKLAVADCDVDPSAGTIKKKEARAESRPLPRPGANDLHAAPKTATK